MEPLPRAKFPGNAPDNHIGRVWFGVKYEAQSEKLLVALVKHGGDALVTPLVEAQW